MKMISNIFFEDLRFEARVGPPSEAMRSPQVFVSPRNSKENTGAIDGCAAIPLLICTSAIPFDTPATEMLRRANSSRLLTIKCNREYDLKDLLCRFEMLRRLGGDTPSEEHSAPG